MKKLVEEQEIVKIMKGVHLLGLNLTETEFEQLDSGDAVALEGKRLGEIGAALILAEALFARDYRQGMTLIGLSEAVTESVDYSGIPIYYWISQYSKRCCLVLTLINGKPAIKVSSQFIIS